MTRLFGNRNHSNIMNGTIAENGCGKLDDFNPDVLRQIHKLGITHIWFTGIIRHATTTDYSAYGISTQNPAVVKGLAGSPYAITDYYDVDPDLAKDVNNRIGEWESLISRVHEERMKVIMDFVPNHVARQYQSIAKPKGVRDLGQDDDNGKGFDTQNNFYYCIGQAFAPQLDVKGYKEYPAKATGNDRFDSHPSVNDWYETVKLNYGIDYMGGGSRHFSPIPSTWIKMTDILLYWADKGIDGFRCDMAEMVPQEFWAYATKVVRYKYPSVIFIGEVYNPAEYHGYINSGFDYLYDKVGMYDCVRDVICGNRQAASITYQWQATSDINERMLYFLENHDEQRIASDFFCRDGARAIPGVITLALMRANPFMVYAGQEYGERGMDNEGFSGLDGRTTIFDYWSIGTIRRGVFNKKLLTEQEKQLYHTYKKALRIANKEKAISDGLFFDLMYVNPQSQNFNPRHHFAFLRKHEDEVLLVITNFSGDQTAVSVTIPSHAFDYMNMREQDVTAVDLLTKEAVRLSLKRDCGVSVELKPYSGRILKFIINMEDEGFVFNGHDKDEFPPAHTAEHLLNQVMIRMFGCERSNDAHIERKKSKISYIIDHKPTTKEVKAIEAEMNDIIQQDLPVTFETVSRGKIPAEINLDKLPSDASEKIRLVRIGDFDVCPCIGKHVRSTAQIGKFEILGTNWDQQKHSFRIRFKVVQ